MNTCQRCQPCAECPFRECLDAEPRGFEKAVRLARRRALFVESSLLDTSQEDLARQYGVNQRTIRKQLYKARLEFFVR